MREVDSALKVFNGTVVLLFASMAFNTCTSAVPHNTNIGKEFVLAASSQICGNHNSTLELHIATYEAKVHVTITVAPFTIQSESEATHFSVQHVIVSRGNVTTATVDGVVFNQRVVQVKAEHGIVLVALCSSSNGGLESFTVIPRKAWDKAYCVATAAPSVIVLLALTDTSVNISHDTGTINSTSSFQTNGDQTINCLRSSEPFGIVLTAALTRSYLWKRARVVEQIPPISRWGRTTVVPLFPAKEINFTDVLVVAESGTYLTIRHQDDSTSRHLIQSHAHNFRINRQANESNQIVVNSGRRLHAVLVQYVTDLLLPVSVFVPPIEQFRADYLLVVPQEKEWKLTSRVTVIALPKDIAGIRLDNEPFTSTPKKNNGSQWTIVSEAVNSGAHDIYHVTSNAKFGVLLYGSNDRGNTYGMFGGMHLAKTTDCKMSRQTDGDGIDNDCDMRSDEEIKNMEDDDNDGLIDEDNALSYRPYLRGESRRKNIKMHRARERTPAGSPRDGLTDLVGPLVALVVCLTGVGFVVTVLIYRKRSMLAHNFATRASFTGNLSFATTSPHGQFLPENPPSAMSSKVNSDGIKQISDLVDRTITPSPISSNTDAESNKTETENTTVTSQTGTSISSVTNSCQPTQSSLTCLSGPSTCGPTCSLVLDVEALGSSARIRTPRLTYDLSEPGQWRHPIEVLCDRTLSL